MIGVNIGDPFFVAVASRTMTARGLVATSIPDTHRLSIRLLETSVWAKASIASVKCGTHAQVCSIPETFWLLTNNPRQRGDPVRWGRGGDEAIFACLNRAIKSVAPQNKRSRNEWHHGDVIRCGRKSVIFRLRL